MAETQNNTSQIRQWIQAGRWAPLATWLKARCPMLASQGRFAEMRTELDVLPTDRLDRDPWLLYWYGTALQFVEPLLAQEYCERAYEKFVARKSRGRWCALAGILDAQLIEYRDLRESDPWIAVVTEEGAEALRTLIRPERMAVIASVFLALVFRHPTHPRIDVWRGLAQRYSEADIKSELGIRLALALMLDRAWRGDLAEAGILMRRVKDARAGSGHRASTSVRLSDLVGHLSDATYALHVGDSGACLQSVRDGLVCAQALKCQVWDSVLYCHAISTHATVGDLDAAENTLRALEHLRPTLPAFDESYFRGMMLWTSYLRGERKIGLAGLARSVVAAADHRGAPYFMGVARVGAVGVIAQEEGVSAARMIIYEIEQIATDIDNPVLKWQAHLESASLALEEKDTDACEEHLRQGLTLGRQLGLTSFFCWHREKLLRLFDYALDHGIEVAYVQHLSQVHRLRPRGDTALSRDWPFPVELRCFEPHPLRVNGTLDPGWVTRSPKQAEFFASLIAHGGTAVPVQRIAKDVYEDESADPYNAVKAIVRSFRALIPGVDVLTLEDRTVSIVFENVRVDACVLRHVVASHGALGLTKRWVQTHYHCEFMAGYGRESTIVQHCRNQFKRLRGTT